MNDNVRRGAPPAAADKMGMIGNPAPEGSGLRGMVGVRSISGGSVLMKPVVSDLVGDERLVVRGDDGAGLSVVMDEKVGPLMLNQVRLDSPCNFVEEKPQLSSFELGTGMSGNCVGSTKLVVDLSALVSDVDTGFCSKEAGQSDMSSMSLMANCDYVSGIRRSGRINGKHVPMVDDSDFDVGDFSYDDDAFLELSNGPYSSGRKKSKAIASIIADLDEEKMFTYGDTLSKEYVVKNNPLPKKCNPSPKGKVEKMLVSEKRSPLSSMRKRKSAQCGNARGKRKNRRRGGCSLVVRRKGDSDAHEEILAERKISMLSWLIDAGVLAENEKVVYKMKNDKGGSLGGCITKDGIRCNCCKEVVSLLQFEEHAGGYFREPWLNTFLVSGKSLMECQREAWEKEKKLRKVGFVNVGVGDLDPTDDTCGVCGDGGNLIICDNCPSTFHQDCLLLMALPEGNWYCPYCSCTFCKLAEHTMLTCYQCGKKYHRECAWGNEITELGPESSSFCGKSCEKVATRLSLIMGTSNSIGDGFSWTLLKRLDENMEGVSEHRRQLYLECDVKLSLALSVLDECFVHLVDQRTGVDMISQVTYNCGSNFKRINYEEFYTMILEKNGEIISVATLRIHGTQLAEMPFIGTRSKFRRQGMCRRLLNAIEDLLSSLNVEKLIIPAISDLLEIWTTQFSFKPLEPSNKDEIRNLSMMVFAETTLLQKPIRSSETKNEIEDAQMNSDSNFENELLETQNFLDSIVATISNGDCVIDDPEFQLQWKFHLDNQNAQSHVTHNLTVDSRVSIRS
ncbi:hypothetical protein QJS04_geneDACA011700 [Acorus gramineus]|uniref:PHD-type domain-containing protein n=1 Tax=Acorus gramineus TaxID=55184 RepID=A0AAV9BKM2_ACOGR|nr:hypothetical protein QJS04_geneDACA011700 [Acorus gramineus]